MKDERYTSSIELDKIQNFMSLETTTKIVEGDIELPAEVFV
jgi:hypothetical protein